MLKGYLVKTLIFVFVYIILTKVGLLLALDGGFATLVWPGSGLALSFLLIYGNSLWPAIAIAAFTINYITGGSIGAASLMSLGNTLEALIASNIIRHYGDVSLIFKKLKSVINFIFASFLGSIVSALIGGLTATLICAKGSCLETIGTWWLGDVASCLLIVPIVLLFNRSNLILLNNRKTYFSFAILILVSFLIFLINYNSVAVPRSLVYLLFIFPLSASLSQSRLSALLQVFIISVFAIWGTIQGKGPFIYPDLNSSLIILQSFTSILIIITLIVSVGIKEKEVIEDKLSNLLKENEVLISEIHHRVKNNLAVVSGLLFLQSETIENEEVRKKLDQTQLRIKTIALVHDKLHKKSNMNINKVEFSNYIKTLAELIKRVYEPAPVPVKLILDIEKIDVEIEKAVPVGLILNELITNSYKHAFAGRSSGEIEIKFHLKEKKYFLLVKDNGVGFEINNISNYGSLGLTLVNSLSTQINADLFVKCEKGCTYELSFNEN